MKETTATIRKSALAPTVLVAGGAGFIGSHLVEALILNNANVVVLDNFSTGKKAYLSNVIDNPKFKLFECDINDGIPPSIESVDYIFHLAGYESYAYGETNISLDSLLTNAVGTKNLLDLAKKCYAKFLLASSIDVYEGVISSFDLNHYFGGSEVEEKKYSHIEAKRFAEALVWEYHRKHKINARIVRLPEVYGPRMDFSAGGELGRLVKSLLDHGDLVVFGDGLEQNYYIFVSDAVNGIVKAEFSNESEGRIYALSDKEPITTLELTYLIKGLSDSEIQVSFRNPSPSGRPRGSKGLNVEYPDDLHWSTKVDLKTGIIKTLRWYGYEFNPHPFKPAKFLEKEVKLKNDGVGITSIRAEHPVPSPSLEPQREKRNFALSIPKLKLPVPKVPVPNLPKFRRPNLFLLTALISIFSVLVFFGVIPAARALYFGKKGYESLLVAGKSVESLNLSKAEKEGEVAAASFLTAEDEFRKLGWAFLLTGQEKRLRTFAKALKISEYSSRAIVNASLGTKPLVSLWESVKPTSKSEIKAETVSEASRAFKKAKEDLERAQAELKEIDPSLLPAGYKDAITKVSDKLPLALDLLDVADEAVVAIPDVLGLEGKKKYLILFQNSSELRPTGGFIGSYAVVTMESGKISEILIDDVYNVDGLLDLNGSKTPSNEPIKKYLEQDFLRIRDANWSVSFPTSAQTILSLFSDANSSKFDGVISINMNLVKDVLSVTGPVFLTAYNEEVTSDNVYERAQYHSEASYTPGSQQKRAFLTVLGSKLLETVFSLEGDKVSGLTKVLFENLDNKHTLVYIPVSPVSSLVSKRGWDGEVKTFDGDFLMIVDSNVGSNKANYYVKEEARYELKNTYRDGALEVNLTLLYQHGGKDLAWPGGPYENYLRVLSPAESYLHGAFVRVNGGEEKDVTGEVTVGSESGKRTFELYFVVNPSETVEVVFNYTLPSSVSLGKGERTYSLYWQKQPGVDDLPVSIVFNEPFGKVVTGSSPPFAKNDKTYTLSTKLQRDLTPTIELK